MPSLRALAVLLAIATFAMPARGDDPDDEARTFRYTRPMPHHRTRALVELGLIVGAGYVNYRLNETSNSADFDLSYDWSSLHGKLTGQNVSFDTNSLPTNYASHAFSGGLYYLALRSNRLGIPESFLVSAATSTFWEYVLEYREKASINDLVYTPMAGFAVGETFTQLGVLFERSDRRPLNVLLADFFGAPKLFNDALDGAEAEPAARVDALGIAADEWHRFDVFTGFGVTWQPGGAKGAARPSRDFRYGFDAEVMNVPDRDFAGWLTDGNLSRLRFESTMTGNDIADLVFAARASTFAYLAKSGRRRFIAAQSVGMEYGYHDYDRDRAQGIDRLSTVDLGVNLEYASTSGAASGRLRLLVAGDFSGTGSYARDTFLARGGSLASLPTILVEQGYYFAVGATAVPTAELSLGRVELGTEMRVDRFWGIRGRDRFQSRIVDEASLSDLRLGARGWLSVRVLDQVVLEASCAQRYREGRVDDVEHDRRETTAMAGLRGAL